MSLQNIRAEIDQLDSQLVHVLNERMRLVVEIGKLKKEQGQAIFAPEREELLLQSLDKQNPGPLASVGLRAIFREVLSASRANQCKLRIAYLALENSNNFLAARMRFGASDCYYAVMSWARALLALAKKKADVAVVPRAQLLTALSKTSSELPFHHRLRICGEIILVREIEKKGSTEKPQSQTLLDSEQFFILTLNETRYEPSGKFVFLLHLPDIQKLDPVLSVALDRAGAKLHGFESTWSSNKRFLCEAHGDLDLNLFGQEILQMCGKLARVTLLGTYPSPNLYG